MSNVLAANKKLTVLHHLVEGSSIRSTERLTGVHRDTIMRLLVSAGNKCREFLDNRMRDLTLKHVEIDEIWTFVQKKQGHLTEIEKDDIEIGDIYLWVALDQDTKLIPSFILGKRTSNMAHTFVLDLASRVVLPKPHDSDAHAYRKEGYQRKIQISSDGYYPYPSAIELAFGPYADYGQIIKNYRPSDQPGRYGPPIMIEADRKPIFGNIEPKTICTSHVERNNLTIRTFMRRFTRSDRWLLKET